MKKGCIRDDDRMKTKGLPALVVVAILLAAVLAPAMGLSLMNNSNSSFNSNESLNESINSEPDPGTPTPSPPIEDTATANATANTTANATDTEANQTETETMTESVDVVYDSTSTSKSKPVIIMFKDKSDAELIKQHGGQIKSVYRLKPALAASLPQKAIDSLRTNPKIDFIVDDLEIFTMGEGETLDWGVDRIDADVVHESNNNGTGINVAIMDTGIDYEHPDLAANYEGGYDFGGGYSGAPNDADPMDFNGHGTHCAGIAAAVRGNGIGVIGVAPEADLYAVKVFTDDGYGRYSDVVEALEWCIDTRTDDNPDNDIRVISMSFGSAYSAGDPGIESWINAAYDAGILLVGAAGNEGNAAGVGDNVGYPARYENVIAVAATDSSDNRASFSSTGPAVELAAPGVSIYSTYLDDGYAAMSGTSMACPHVTGTAALVWNAYPEYNNTEVRQRLQGTVEDLGDPGKDNEFGYGLVDAEKAAVDTTPPASVKYLKSSAVGRTWINWTWNDPADADFSHVIVHLNGVRKTNVSKRLRFYNVTSLEPVTSYEIGTQTVDEAGNINETWVNQTVETNGEGEIVILGDGDPINKLYESSTSNFQSETAVIALLSSRNSTANNVDFVLASNSLYTFVNATSNAMGSDIVITSSSTINFSAYFDCGDRVNYAYATWKFYKVSDSTETLICQKGNDGTSGIQLPDGGTATLTGSCTATSNVTLSSTDKLRLVLNVWAETIGGGKEATKRAKHYWDSTYDSWVQYEYIAPPPVTPFMIYGGVNYSNGTACLNPSVNITNTNTITQWQAETNASYNYYQLILDTTNISTDDVLSFNVTDGSQYNITNHTVTQSEISNGGLFNFNLTLPSAIVEGPDVVLVDVTPDPVTMAPCPTTTMITVNATVSDPNGVADIKNVNITHFNPSIPGVSLPIEMSKIEDINPTTAKYQATVELPCCTPADTYTVTVEAKDKSDATDTGTGTFTVDPTRALSINFDTVSFSGDPDSTNNSGTAYLGGSEVIDPVVTSMGNDPIDIGVNATNLLKNGTGPDKITGDNTEATIGATPDWQVVKPEYIWNTNLECNTATDIGFRLDIPLGTPEGTYTGSIIITPWDASTKT